MNNIKQLPPGLFAKNNKLKVVNLQYNMIENLTRDNFMHCASFDELMFDQYGYR